MLIKDNDGSEDELKDDRERERLIQDAIGNGGPIRVSLHKLETEEDDGNHAVYFQTGGVPLYMCTLAAVFQAAEAQADIQQWLFERLSVLASCEDIVMDLTHANIVKRD